MDIQYYISFQWTAKWVGIYINYKVSPMKYSPHPNTTGSGDNVIWSPDGLKPTWRLKGTAGEASMTLTPQVGAHAAVHPDSTLGWDPGKSPTQSRRRNSKKERNVATCFCFSHLLLLCLLRPCVTEEHRQ